MLTHGLCWDGTMWLKLFFLLLYLMVLFALARIFEAVVWYETGMFATQLVDPVTLSYKKLKTILECRGLGYSGLAEKKDVSELVEKSGNCPMSLTFASTAVISWDLTRGDARQDADTKQQTTEFLRTRFIKCEERSSGAEREVGQTSVKGQLHPFSAHFLCFHLYMRS